MSQECHIVKDLLPLYIEEMVSDSTAEWMKAHIASCPDCRRELENSKKQLYLPEQIESMPLKQLKKKLFAKKALTIFFTAALVLVFIVSGFAYLTAPQYFSYAGNLLTVTKDEIAGSISIQFRQDVTGYTYHTVVDSDTGTELYYISAWSTAWERYFISRGQQNMVLPLDDADKKMSVFYAQNNGEKDVLLYGEPLPANSSTTSLPRLALGYYFMLVALALILFAIVYYIFRHRDNRIRFWIEKGLLLCLSYLMGHLCIKGFTMKTYSLQRDLSLILFVAAIIFCALMLGVTLYRNKQDRKKKRN